MDTIKKKSNSGLHCPPPKKQKQTTFQSLQVSTGIIPGTWNTRNLKCHLFNFGQTRCCCSARSCWISFLRVPDDLHHLAVFICWKLKF